MVRNLTSFEFSPCRPCRCWTKNSDLLEKSLCANAASILVEKAEQQDKREDNIKYSVTRNKLRLLPSELSRNQWIVT